MKSHVSTFSETIFAVDKSGGRMILDFIYHTSVEVLIPDIGSDETQIIEVAGACFGLGHRGLGGPDDAVVAGGHASLGRPR
ncbi:unnamed protein product [Dovyalis caffra]|uniref:Uncharacterized protein n=1 Tax=Dovyalis caffra TaxID=77055 RepID=A0AAV1RRT2_9ROSI|nr:unnamed protein product [Dovyalis caffra]